MCWRHDVHHNLFYWLRLISHNKKSYLLPMSPDPLKKIQQQLIELEKKMLQEINKRAEQLKTIHPLQKPAAKNLLQNGMNVARINCAHDDETTWARMIHHLKRACRHTGLSCKIYMDLAGPKIRTRFLSKGINLLTNALTGNT